MPGHQLTPVERDGNTYRWHRKRIRLASTASKRVTYAASYVQASLRKLPEAQAEKLANKIVESVLKTLREERYDSR